MEKLIENITAYYQQIINIGVGEYHSILEVQRIQLINLIISMALVSEVLLMSQAFIFGEFLALGIGALLVLISVLPLYFNYNGKINAAIWTFVVYSPISLVILIVLYGKEITTPYSFIIFTIHLIIFLSKFWHRVAYTILVLGLSYFAFYYVNHFESPLAREFNIVEKNCVFVSVVIFLILVLKNYSDLVQKTLKEVADLLNQQKISNQKMVYKKGIIEQQNKQLQLANEELEKFAYIASHDLKSPLRNVSSFLSLIERKIKKGRTDTILEDIQYASRASQQMYRLIEDILRFSRMKQQEMSFHPLDLNDVLMEVVMSLNTVLKDNNAEISNTVLPTIEANESQIMLLLQNLIENGIKYNESTPKEISIYSQEIDGNIIISIRDNGIGIPMHYQEKVFEMFARLHNQQQYEGTGLGLAICKRIVNAHHGNIWFESDYKGTVFHVELPIKQMKNLGRNI